MNPNQHWCFFLLFIATFMFSLGVILSDPGPGTTATSTTAQVIPVQTLSAMSVDGRRVYLVTPHLKSTGNNALGLATPLRMEAGTTQRLLLVQSSSSLATSQPKTQQGRTIEETSHSLPSTNKSHRSSSSRSWVMVFGCIVASVFMGVKLGTNAMKSKNFVGGYFVDEEKEKELALKEELVYDIAYTSTSSEIGYGSVAGSAVTTSSYWDVVDKFDV